MILKRQFLFGPECHIFDEAHIHQRLVILSEVKDLRLCRFPLGDTKTQILRCAQNDKYMAFWMNLTMQRSKSKGDCRI